MKPAMNRRPVVTPWLAGVLVAGALLAPTAHAAGQIEVNFVKPDDYADIGMGSVDRERTLKQLARVFETLAPRVPDGQTLKLDVLDVDLAGQAWPYNAQNIRVMRGRADWPRMTLRYSLLRADGSTAGSGQARLADMAYLDHINPSSLEGPLVYERRMVVRWYDETFGASRTAAIKENP